MLVGQAAPPGGAHEEPERPRVDVDAVGASSPKCPPTPNWQSLGAGRRCCCHRRCRRRLPTGACHVVPGLRCCASRAPGALHLRIVPALASQPLSAGRHREASWQEASPFDPRPPSPPRPVQPRPAPHAGGGARPRSTGPHILEVRRPREGTPPRQRRLSGGRRPPPRARHAAAAGPAARARRLAATPRPPPRVPPPRRRRGRGASAGRSSGAVLPLRRASSCARRAAT